MKRWVVLFTILALVVASMSACATNASLPRDVPLPSDINIIAPGPDVPKELTAFSGIWAGSWPKTKAGAELYGFDENIVLVVEAIWPTGALVVFAHGPAPLAIYAKAGWSWRFATVQDGQLILQFPEGSRVSFALDKSGTILYAVYDRGEFRNTTKLWRVPNSITTIGDSKGR